MRSFADLKADFKTTLFPRDLQYGITSFGYMAHLVEYVCVLKDCIRIDRLAPREPALKEEGFTSLN